VSIISGLGTVPAFIGGGFVKEMAQSLPAMTGDSAPAGYTAFANGIYGGGYEAFRAFNNNLTDFWHSSGVNGIIGRSVPTAIRVWRYRIYPRPGEYGQFPAAWTFQGSNDGSSYVTLDTRSGQSVSSLAFVDYDVPEANRGKYRYHRLNCTHSSYTALPEIQLLQEV